MKKFNKKGFTLVEMLVVIAIIAVLVSIIIPTVSSSTVKANAAADAANLRSISASVATQYLGNGSVGSVPTAACKTVPAADEVVVSEVAGAIQAYFTDGTKYYSVDEFATTAKTGTAPSGVTTLPGTKIYPAD